MRRLRIVGICAVAVLALSAVGASAAQAAEVGECVKVPRLEGVFHGHYLDKNCQLAASPAEEAEGKHNKWEWSPGVKPENASFKAKTAAVTFEGPAGTIECKKTTTVAEWTSATKGTEQTTFTDCEPQTHRTPE